MARVNLFTNQAADGNSTSFQVKEYAGAISNEGVIVQGSGTWSSTTLKFEICANPTASPQVWSTAKNVKDDGTVTDISLTADFAINIDVVTGALYRVALSGSGSPLPSLSVDAVGDIE